MTNRVRKLMKARHADKLLSWTVRHAVARALVRCLHERGNGKPSPMIHVYIKAPSLASWQAIATRTATARETPRYGGHMAQVTLDYSYCLDAPWLIPAGGCWAFGYLPVQFAMERGE